MLFPQLCSRCRTLPEPWSGPQEAKEIDLFELYEKVRHHPGAAWIKSDLHIHTPASHDFKWGDLSRDDFDAYKYVAAMQEHGLELIAVTDHCSASWVDVMKKAAKDRRKHGRVTVLPGVEITASGVHLTLIFSESKDGEFVHYVLSKLGIEPAQRGVKETVCSKSIEDVADICHENDGLIIGAHCLSSVSGILGKHQQGITRQRALKKLDAIEIKPGQAPDEARSRALALGRTDIPIVVSSDAHTPLELSDQVGSFKMGSPTFKGLRQIRFEPSHRVASAPPDAPVHPRIIGFFVNQGILREVPVCFSPHLNVLIGGRGAGKSAALDVLRFAFGIHPRVQANEADFRGRIRNFIGVGGVVWVFLQDIDGQILCIERRGDCTVTRGRGKRDQIEFDYDPQLYRLVSDQFVQLDTTPQEHFPVEFFGQGEVMELTRKADDQLALLDEHVDFGELPQREKRLLALLTSNRDAILRIEETIEELEQLAAELPTLQRRLDYLQEKLRNPVLHTRTYWDQERSYMEWAGQRLQSLRRRVESAPPSSSAPPPVSPETPNLSITADVRNVITSLTHDLGQMIAAFQTRVVAADEQFERICSTWATLDAAAEENFQSALRESGVAELQDLHREQRMKEQSLRQITEVVAPQLAEQRQQIEKHYCERSRLVSDLTICRNEIHRRRADQLASLSETLRAIKIEVAPGGDRRAYSESMREMYQGAGIHNSDGQLERVVEHLLPHDLAELIQRKDVDGIVAASGVTAGTATKIVGHPSLDRVLDLQAIDTCDAPTISLQRGGHGALPPLSNSQSVNGAAQF